MVSLLRVERIGATEEGLVDFTIYQEIQKRMEDQERTDKLELSPSDYSEK